MILIFGKQDEQQQEYGMGASAQEAFSFWNIVRSFLLFIVFGLLLSLKTLISSIDKVGQSGGGVLDYVMAIGGAVLHGICVTLGSMWAVLINPSLYMESHSYGSLIFTAFSIIAMICFFYQPISFFINIVDMKKGQATSWLLRGVITIVIVLVLSCVAYYAGGQDSMVTKIGDNESVISDNESVEQPLVDNVTIDSSSDVLSSTIDLG